MDNNKLTEFALILEKTADYIESIETQLSELQAKINASPVETEKQAEINKKLESIGFTKEEIGALSNVPEPVLTKVANMSTEPWELGKGVGMPREKTDPFLEFLLS